MLQLEKYSWGSRGFLSYRYQKNESKMELHELSGVPAWNEKLNSLIPTSWTLREGKGSERTGNSDAVFLVSQGHLER